MRQTVCATPGPAHLLRSESGPRVMAKADLRFPESPDFRAAIGQCIDRARLSLAWNLDEFARHLGDRDPRQIARWIAGSERPQFDVLFACEPMRVPLVIQLAGLSADVEVTTQITVRRLA